MPADKKYGGFNKDTKEWNGMVRDLIDRKTDLTIALSVNTERSEYIDYTASFYESQAAFTVYVQSSMSSSNIFFFLEPFQITVWVTIIGLIVVVALITSFFSKLSPYGSYGRRIHAMQTCTCADCSTRREIKRRNKCGFADTKTYNCELDKADSDDEIDDLNVYNSTWLIGTGFVLQGTDTLPVAPSGRFLLFMWWLFIMILTSMYTANLTAHLTLERSSITVTNLDEILNQNKYEWGLITDRNLESMMLNHEEEKYRSLAGRGVKLQSLDEGMQRVKEGGFIFIDESSVLSFNFKDECEAVQTDTGKFNNQWSFGTQVNSPYASVINNMFLQYRERGWFSTKFDEWYTGGDEVACTTSVGNDTKFDLPILSGLFLILAVGIAISFVIVVIEIFYVSYQDSRESMGSYCECLWNRIRLKLWAIKDEWFRRPRNKMNALTLDNKNSNAEPL
uniref:Lig_chan domain-containing protein n=1 Tax=Thalassocalyce inconstans TaxID=140487 RepID=V9PPU9_THAIN|nr:Lig_chan domain-containing protein [Thalassocalyce inconstans]